jgi:phosphonate transport system permease protein
MTDIKDREISKNPYLWTPFKSSITLVITACVVMVAVKMCVDTGFLPKPLIEGLLGDQTKGMGTFKDLLRPNFSGKLIVDLSLGMWQTIEIGFLGTILAVILSLPLAFLGAFNLMGSRWPQKGVFYFIRMFFNAVRAFESFILLLILMTIFGYNELAGILAIGIHSIGMLGKLFAEAIENVDKGQVEAIQAVGGSRLQVIFYGIIPQTFPLMIGYSLYRFDINVRMAYILGWLGIGGIGYMLYQYINAFLFNELSTAFILTLVIISLIDYMSTYVRNKVLA